jgi:hypothetical protein
MAQWARNPPSTKRVLIVLVTIVICLALVGIERWVGWPDWATADRLGGPRMWGR